MNPSYVASPANALHIQAFSEIALVRPGLASVDTGDEDEPFTLHLSEIDGENRSTVIVGYPFHDIELVKRLLLKRLGLRRRYKISDVEILYNGIEMPNRRLLNSFASIAETEVRMRWRLKERISKGTMLRGLRERAGTKLHPRLQPIVEEVHIALQKRINPKLTMEGTGATYLLYDTRSRPVGVFKPNDEEAFAPNNPRGYVGKMGQAGFRAGVMSGEGATREVAAFLLDAFYGGFSGVPVTVQVDMIHPHFCYDPSNPRKMRFEDDAELFADGLLRKKKKKKDEENPDLALSWKQGSLQEFVNARDSASDYDPRMFCVGDVHRVGILDIRLANMDRNDGNLLVVKNEDVDIYRINEELLYPRYMEERPEYKATALLTPEEKVAKLRLIPIDHGLTLPDCLDITDFDLAWLNWPQAHMPLLPAEVEYIQLLRPDKDADWLSNKLALRPACLRVMQTTTRLLKRGAKHGLTLHQMAMLMVRMSPGELSPLEKVIKLSVSQAAFANFATSLVHKRDLGMKYAMDLAATVPQKETPVKSVNWQYSEDDSRQESEEHFKNGASETSEDAKAEQAGRPRSKTMGRISLSGAAGLGSERGGTRLRKLNFTTFRERDESASLSSLWTVVDSAGRLVTPDWNDARFKRLFFEALETMLDFLIKEKYRPKVPEKP